MKNKPVIGISECLTGAAVRFDGGHKRMDFVMNSLAPWVTYKNDLPGGCNRPARSSPCAAPYPDDLRRHSDAL
ncbi:pathogenicity island protein [Salmonella enterica subsp. arizonae]|nr:pathogenicity island protein [Salmonella enterica subsp. arizonae]